MKFVCTKSDIIKGVSIASKAVSSKSTMPILECFLISANDNNIKITANDMELGIETIINGQTMEKGSIAVNARLFSDIVRKLPDNDITISTLDHQQILITCEMAKFTIGYLNVNEFSTLPEVSKERKIVVSEYNLKKIINQTIFSISDNDNNPLMRGELFEINGNRFKVVSLDGHRISIRQITLKEEYENTKCVVPGKTLNDLTKILGGEIDKDVSIYFSDNNILFEFENTKVLSRVIEGEYFRIDQMLSFDYQTKLKVNKAELFSSIDRATLLINESDKKPILMCIKDESIALKMQTMMGSMDEEISVKKEGKDIDIAFNPKFITDALRSIEEEEVTVYMVNSKAPCIIKDDNETFIYLILPVNFNSVVR